LNETIQQGKQDNLEEKNDINENDLENDQDDERITDEPEDENYNYDREMPTVEGLEYSRTKKKKFFSAK